MAESDGGVATRRNGGGLETLITDATPRLLPDRVSAATLVFALAMICYTANGKTIGSGDTLPARYLPFGILNRGTFYLNYFPFLHHRKAYWVRQIGNHRVSFYPVGAAIAALPWYAPAIIAGAQPGERRSEDLGKAGRRGHRGVVRRVVVCRASPVDDSQRRTVDHDLPTRSAPRASA